MEPRYFRKVKNSDRIHFHRRHKSIQDTTENQSINSSKVIKFMKQCDVMEEKYTKAINKVVKFKNRIKKRISLLESYIEDNSELITSNRRCFIYGKNGRGCFLSSYVQ